MIDPSTKGAEPAAGIAGQSGAVDLVSVYSRFFYYRIARSRTLLETAYRLRYQVYCEETDYLSRDANPNGMECDEYDQHSVSSVLIHRPTGHAAGTVRLVLPRPAEPGCAQPARLHAPTLDALDESVLPRATTGEISRFAIAAQFRKRQDDSLYASVLTRDMPDPRRVIPHITLGLMTSMFEICLDEGLTHLCAVIDPALLRLLAKLGLHFNTVGPCVEYHGPRQPVYVSCFDLRNRLIAEHPEIYRVISADGRFKLDTH